MATATSRDRESLPRGWRRRVRSGVVQAIALAQLALTRTRAWATHSRSPVLRRRAEADRLEQEVALLREEIRIKDTRVDESVQFQPVLTARESKHPVCHADLAQLRALARARANESLGRCVNRFAADSGDCEEWLPKRDAQQTQDSSSEEAENRRSRSLVDFCAQLYLPTTPLVTSAGSL